MKTAKPTCLLRTKSTRYIKFALTVMIALASCQFLISLHNMDAELTQNNPDEVLEQGKTRSNSNEIQIQRSKKASPLEKQERKERFADWKQILFYNPTKFQEVRGIRNISYFNGCIENKCYLTFNKSLASQADAIVFDMRRLKDVPMFYRPHNQVWILVQHEASWRYSFKKANLMKNFNWTMTYSEGSDIPLPYGRLKQKDDDEIEDRNYVAIAKRKTKDAIWIASHCQTNSKREDYVNILRNYIDVDVFGACGRKWKCGQRFDHDAAGDCFSILNSTYRYHLAFENSLCKDYITEKFFENYKYDILQVARGGDLKKRPIDAAQNVYISTTDFTSAHQLGEYLQLLSKKPMQYALMLKEKDKYNVVGYPELLKDALCDICHRLHNIGAFQQKYENIRHWIKENEPCYQPSDIF